MIIRPHYTDNALGFSSDETSGQSVFSLTSCSHYTYRVPLHDELLHATPTRSCKWTFSNAKGSSQMWNLCTIRSLNSCKALCANYFLIFNLFPYLNSGHPKIILLLPITLFTDLIRKLLKIFLGWKPAVGKAILTTATMNLVQTVYKKEWWRAKLTPAPKIKWCLFSATSPLF